MPEPHVTWGVKDGVGMITLNRPRVLNALHEPLLDELVDAVDQAAADPSAWVVVLRGAGRAFCSGIDRTALAKNEIGERFYRQMYRATNGLEDMDKVVIALMHGWSIGGGLQLACACDLRLAAEDTITGLGASRHGLIPDSSVLRLARIIGLGRAKELTLLNNQIDAHQALAMGLVNWVVPAAELETSLAGVVEKLFFASRTANAHNKRLLHESFHRDPRSMLDELAAAQRDCLESWELRLANDAWLRKEDARFYPGPEPA